ncbi:flagellar protein FlaG [Desulfoglaeba alkanexedens]|uniref:Flagellar protein FlaG n=1 Tax=Desulfoglaeba alkanexedens ALDC TaxID=980445 RepID=A0A4P8L437_9BACT|nr:flagellar protein FlaG [Desulfoglaeba alkanexedens]QCQ22669.1 flagellar protein FlaG [Desulfoglaeba alkanexedens ALDC]
METKVENIKPLVAESWVRQDQSWVQRELVRPVPKDEGISSAQAKKEEKPPSDDMRLAKERPEEVKTLVEEVQSYLEDLNIRLKFIVHEETGDVVVRVLNKETGELIREIPPEELLKLRQKLEELRGVLFHGEV